MHFADIESSNGFFCEELCNFLLQISKEAAAGVLSFTKINWVRHTTRDDAHSGVAQHDKTE